MESRIYEEKFIELRNSIFSLLKVKNLKAIEYEKKTITEYLGRLSKGDFQMKSFKSKTIYFENQKKKYQSEVSEAINAAYKLIKDFLDSVMLQMEAEKDSLEIQERRNDLLEKNQDVKRRRQDNANRMSAIDKDYQQKLKDAQNEVNDKEKAYLNYQNEASKKLNIDIQKIVDNYNKKSLPLEKSLLTIDDKKKILEIKAKIKELRVARLEEEHKTKLAHIEKLKEDSLNLLKVISAAKCNLEAIKNDYATKKLENSNSNDLLSLESEANIFNYDLDKRDQGFALINEIYNQKVEYFNSIRDQKRNVYARELYLKKKYNDKLFLFASINAIHPFLNLINYILKEYSEYANYFNELIEGQTEMKNLCLNKAAEYVNRIDLEQFKGKAKERKKLDDSIRKCINSLLDTNLLNDEYNQVIDFFDKILNVFNTKNIELDKKDEFLNNIYVYERTINRYDSKEKFDNDMAYISSEFNKYKDAYNLKREKDVNNFNELIEKKTLNANNNYKGKLEKENNSLSQSEQEFKDELEKRLLGAEKDYSQDVLLEDKSYKARLLTL